MKKRLVPVAVVALLLTAAGCGKANQAQRDQQAIHAALEKYLAERGNLNLAAMDMDIKQITTDQNRAEAQVEFRAKQGGAGMQMTYTLERQGDTWIVRAGRPSGGMMSHPPMGEGMPPSQTGDLPAGHPPLTDQGKAPAPAKKP